jgi:lipopolysaccharide biosynthesis glycosyltransferase
MTLRRLNIRTPLRPEDARSPRTALAFAFDAEYVEPFHVMIYSLARANTLLDCPIYVYSNDPTVYEDPIVRLVTDRFHLIEGADLAELEDVAENHVERPERAKWNRGTCLKWSIFDEAPVDQLLFLDVDMLCLRPLEGLLSLYPGSAIVCCPQFQRVMAPSGQGRRSQLETKSRLLELIFRRSPYMGRVNSGLMLVRKPLLSRAFRETLVAFARKRSEINEQSHLTNLFRDPNHRRSFPSAMASSSYNFQENYLDLVDRIDAMELMRRVRVLHYAGAQKPWRAKGPNRMRATMQLWWQFKQAFDEDRAAVDA